MSSVAIWSQYSFLFYPVSHLGRNCGFRQERNPLDQTKLVFLKRETNPLDQARGQIDVFVKARIRWIKSVPAETSHGAVGCLPRTGGHTGGDGGRGASKWSKVMPVVMAATIRTGWRAKVSIPHTPINVFLIGHRRHHQHWPCSTFAQSSNCFQGVFLVFGCFSTLWKSSQYSLYKVLTLNIVQRRRIFISKPWQNPTKHQIEFPIKIFEANWKTYQQRPLSTWQQIVIENKCSA